MTASSIIVRVAQPSAPLRPCVERLWYHEGIVCPHPMERLVPDGGIELIVDLMPTFVFAVISAVNLAMLLGTPGMTLAMGACCRTLAGVWVALGIATVALFERRPWRWAAIKGATGPSPSPHARHPRRVAIASPPVSVPGVGSCIPSEATLHHV